MAPSPKKILILECWRRDWKQPDRLARIRAWDPPAPQGLAIFYGCSRGQTGYEHPNNPFSAFYYFLIRGFLGEAAEAQVTGTSLAQYCKGQVSKLVSDTYRGADQVPVLATMAERSA